MKTGKRHLIRRLFRRSFVFGLLLVFFGSAGLALYLRTELKTLPVVAIGVVGLDADSRHPRADAILVILCRPASGRVVIVRVPRDTFVHSCGRRMRVNALYARGELWAWLEKQLHLHLSRRIVLRFEDLARLIDAAGGIEVDIGDRRLPKYEDRAAQTSFGPFTGRMHLNGNRAVTLARYRRLSNGRKSSDLARIDSNQKLVEMAVLARFRQCAKDPMLPFTLCRLNRAWSTLHSDLSFREALSLAVSLRNAGRNGQFVRTRLPGTINGAGVELEKEQTAMLISSLVTWLSGQDMARIIHVVCPSERRDEIYANVRAAGFYPIIHPRTGVPGESILISRLGRGRELARRLQGHGINASVIESYTAAVSVLYVGNRR